MKSSYDIVGTGEGVSGLLASVLLGAKGFSCLWSDAGCADENRNTQQGIPLLVSAPLWDRLIRPLLSAVDTSLAESLPVRRVQCMQSLVPGYRRDLAVAGRDNRDAALPRDVQHYLERCVEGMKHPWAPLKDAKASAPEGPSWEQTAVQAMSHAGETSRLSRLRYQTALLGMYALDYVALKELLIAHLTRGGGNVLQGVDAGLQQKNRVVTGLNVGGKNIKGRYYLSETCDSAKPDGFLLYLRLVVDSTVIPVGMGDLVFLSPPEDCPYPLQMSLEQVDDRTVLSVMSKVPVERKRLLTLTELVSWAQERALSRVREVIPFLDDHLISVEAFSPEEQNAVRDWCAFGTRPMRPSLLGRKHYIEPLDRLFLCDRRKLACMGGDGELVWGICLANAILKDLNRSDLYQRPLS